MREQAKCNCGWLFPLVSLYSKQELPKTTIVIECPKCKRKFEQEADKPLVVMP